MNIDDENKTKENKPEEVETKPIESDWTFSKDEKETEKDDK